MSKQSLISNIKIIRRSFCLERTIKLWVSTVTDKAPASECEHKLMTIEQ